jgi:hypothetical protein
MKTKAAVPRCGLLVIDLRNGDIVHWSRLQGDITELFDVGIIRTSVARAGLGLTPRGWRRRCGGRISVIKEDGLAPLKTRCRPSIIELNAQTSPISKG